MKIHHFKEKKIKSEKITFVTCYDYTSAKIVDASDVDCVLVGDSLAMTMHGYHSTIPASIELMRYHTQAVTRATQRKFIVADMPFLSYRKTLSNSMDAVQSLMQAGAHAIKLEGAEGNVRLIEHIVESGVPVMGHIGLTPQSLHALGGYRVQGCEASPADHIMKQACLLEETGCFAIVLECIPSDLAKRISETLKIPTIGIGAGPYTDGQVLVWQDLLGMQADLNIKFVKRYLDGFNVIKNALNAYHDDVKKIKYPELELHAY